MAFDHGLVAGVVRVEVVAAVVGGISRSGSAGSRTAWSKSMTPSNAPLVRIQLVDGLALGFPGGGVVPEPWNGVSVAPRFSGRPRGRRRSGCSYPAMICAAGVRLNPMSLIPSSRMTYRAPDTCGRVAEEPGLRVHAETDRGRGPGCR